MSELSLTSQLFSDEAGFTELMYQLNAFGMDSFDEMLDWAKTSTSGFMEDVGTDVEDVSTDEEDEEN